ncbi:hypothetical protein MY3957_001418 [Beauveria namnaoensis]
MVCRNHSRWSAVVISSGLGDDQGLQTPAVGVLKEESGRKRGVPAKMSTSSTLMLLEAGEPEKRTHLTIRDCKLSLFEYFALYGVVRLDTCSCLDGLVARNPDGRFQEHAGSYDEEYGRRVGEQGEEAIRRDAVRSGTAARRRLSTRPKARGCQNWVD